jgi:hypothetical protein
MTQKTIPLSLLDQVILELERGLEETARWHGRTFTITLESVIGELRSLITNPVHQWVGTAEAARITGRSEETIRRRCRSDTASFRFYRDQASGRYLIWLADLAAGTRDL